MAQQDCIRLWQEFALVQKLYAPKWTLYEMTAIKQSNYVMLCALPRPCLNGYDVGWLHGDPTRFYYALAGKQ